MKPTKLSPNQERLKKVLKPIVKSILTESYKESFDKEEYIQKISKYTGLTMTEMHINVDTSDDVNILKNYLKKDGWKEQVQTNGNHYTFKKLIFKNLHAIYFNIDKQHGFAGFI